MISPSTPQATIPDRPISPNAEGADGLPDTTALRAIAEQISLAEKIADAVAEAIGSIGTAYSHGTLADMSTWNPLHYVYDIGEGGNPFDRDPQEWLGQFKTKAEANALAQKLRRERAVAAVSDHIDAQARALEEAWRDGWVECRNRVADDEAFCLTEDVEEDAWLDSKTRAASQSLARQERVEG